MDGVRLRPTSPLRWCVAVAVTVFLATGCTGPGDRGSADRRESSGLDIGYVEGTIRIIGTDADGTQRSASVQLGDGSVVDAVLPGADPYAPADVPAFEEGQRVEIYFAPTPGGGREYVVSDWIRRPALLWLVAAFLVVSVVVARFKGFRAFVATGASLAIIVRFVVPQITSGADPIVTSLLGVGGILILAIYFVHGVTWSTTAALIGTFVAALATMVLGIVFSDAAHLTGLGSEDAAMIAASAPQVALRGLMLAGLMIGALGALTDITIVQAAVVREMAHLDPALRVRDLYGRGMNVGLDHVGSLVNTLVLAYTGAALPLLVLLGQAEIGFARAVNLEIIAAEVVHTLVGSIGLILAVPVTTAIAAFMFRGDRLPLAKGELDHAHAH